MAAHRLRQVEAYFTVREVLSGASTAADGVLSRERSGFRGSGLATLGLRPAVLPDLNRNNLQAENSFRLDRLYGNSSSGPSLPAADASRDPEST